MAKVVDLLNQLEQVNNLSEEREELPTLDSTYIIGDVKEHFDNVFSEDRRWDTWSAFYNGWIDGRGKMVMDLKSTQPKQPNPLKTAIKGDVTPEYGKKIIEYFEGYGNNEFNFDGGSDNYYFIGSDGFIRISNILPEGYTEISLK